MSNNEALDHCVQMNINDNQLIEASRLAIQENPDNALDSYGVSKEAIDNNEMALITAKKWKSGRTLRVRFLDGNTVIQEKVKKYANEWSRYANIKFLFGDDSNAEIRITFRHKGFWSYVGTDNLGIPINQPTMSLTGLTPASSESQISRVVLHEFGHCIGISHEQASPGANIPWDKPAVYRYYAENSGWSKEMVDQNVLAKLNPQGVSFTPHDSKSIMQYPVPNELTIGDFEIGWNTSLSEIDKIFIGKMYPL